MTGPTRLVPPVPARTAIVRRRLLAQLQQRWRQRLVTVVGGPGFGKTTLLAQAVAENRLDQHGLDLWLTCGPDDATASSLAAGLRAAVGAAPGPEDDTPRAVADAVLLRAPLEVALVLDDAHEIPEGSAGAQLLARVLDALPANGHLVVGSRAAPPLPAARLEAQGQVLRVAEDDLAFTDDEVVAFAALREVPEAQISEVEGWPALAELAAIAGGGSVHDFVWQEVLATVPAEERSLLARLSLLPVVDASLAEALAGHPVDLEAVVQHLPMVLAGPAGERSLHPLWGRVLARELTAEEAADSLCRAAAVLAERGEASRAMHLLIDAEAWDDVRRHIVRVFGASHSPVPADVLATWFRRLPEDVQVSVEGRLLGALAHRPTGRDADLAPVADALVALADAFGAAGDGDGELATLIQLGHVAWWRERHDILIGVVGRVLELEARGHTDAGPIASIGRAIMADTMADHERVLFEVEQIAVNALNDEWRSITEWLRSMALLSRGYAHEALEPAIAAASIASAPVRAPAEGARLHALWFTGHVDEVIAALPPLLADANASALPRYIAVAGAQGCYANALIGDVAAAAPFLLAARAVHGDSNSLTAAHLAIADAAMAIATGDEDEAARLLAEEVERRGLLRGLSASAQMRTLALWYVLLPDTRPVWEAAEIGPSASEARALARALAALREKGSLAAIAGLRVVAPAGVRAHLPLPWAALLAVGLVAAGRPEGDELLEAIWPAARPAVRALAEDAPTPEVVKAAKAVLARLPAPPARALTLGVLGPVELDVSTPEWRRERVRTLLLHLVVHRRATRERIAADLWPELDAAGGSRNLRVTLTYLNRVLEPDRAEGDAPFLVRQEGGSLELHAGDWLAVDAWTFEEHLAAAAAAERDGAPSAALAAYEAALALWRGEPFTEVYDDWAVAEADRLRQLFVRSGVRCAELQLALGEADRALGIAERVAAVDEWSEPAHRLLVASHLALRDQGSARRALDQYRKLLGELGTPPGEAAVVLERLMASAG